MGQVESFSSFPDAVDSFQDTIIRQAKSLSEISSLTYDQFNEHLKELNALSLRCMDSDGKQLLFAVKMGSDSSVLWKATVRIACVKYDPKSKETQCCRLLNLGEFLKIFKTIKNEVVTAQQIDVTNVRADSLMQRVTSVVTNNNENSYEPSTECCICLERKQEITLPCAHSYCQPCINMWNVNNNTCPVCREVLTNSNEEWILFDAPNSAEINEHIAHSLINIVADSAD